MYSLYLLGPRLMDFALFGMGVAGIVCLMTPERRRYAPVLLLGPFILKILDGLVARLLDALFAPLQSTEMGNYLYREAGLLILGLRFALVAGACWWIWKRFGLFDLSIAAAPAEAGAPEPASWWEGERRLLYNKIAGGSCLIGIGLMLLSGLYFPEKGLSPLVLLVGGVWSSAQILIFGNVVYFAGPILDRAVPAEYLGLFRKSVYGIMIAATVAVSLWLFVLGSIFIHIRWG